MAPPPVRLEDRDALIVVDVQNDFLPGGALAVPDGDAVIPLLNTYIERFVAHHRPIFATRDWHPANHCSFHDQGGPWPPHCIAGTAGAAFPMTLRLPDTATIVAKADTLDHDAYSGFAGTGLAEQLHRLGIRRVFIGGLATDYCVLNTVIDALGHGFEAFLLTDAVRAVDVTPGDGTRAITRMIAAGARPITHADIAA